MTTRTIQTIALAGTLALAFTGSAFAQAAGGGTELPSGAKEKVPSDVSGSPANKASNGGAGSSGAMKGDSMKGGSSMKSGGGSMTK